MKAGSEAAPLCRQPQIHDTLIFIIIIIQSQLPHSKPTLSFKMSVFVFPLFRSEFLNFSSNPRQKKLVLNGLLYIIIQKDIPAMGCLDAVLWWEDEGRLCVGGAVVLLLLFFCGTQHQVHARMWASPRGRSSNFVSDGAIGALRLWRITVWAPELQRVLRVKRENRNMS